MIEKPIEWRRFERVELEGEVARTAPRLATVSPVPTPPSLLHEFERVLRENERLQIEVNRLREEAAKGGRTPKFREELESARIELARIECAPDAAPAASASAPTGPSHHVAAEPSAPSLDEAVLKEIAHAVAGYIFSTPSPARVRLVEDALRGRGLTPPRSR